MKYSLLAVALTAALLAALAACTAVTPSPTPSAETVTPPAGETPAADGYVYAKAEVEDVQVELLESFPVQARALITGTLGDGCTEINDTVVDRLANTFKVTITTRRPRAQVCTLILRGFNETVNLPVWGLPAGDYIVDANGMTGTFTLAVDNVAPSLAPTTTLPVSQPVSLAR